ncbi:hypothetical protein GCM10007874_15810 [Labrys miyagiensis]|uniref:Uncharacterized protein n=1 Tax=Labrys miyagiensis TaxID=346912 RepID=A0ABQ6CEC2_9HYPH|nr:hypothetical protein GCM10007874_15810 [Labrys miyagiensis]
MNGLDQGPDDLPPCAIPGGVNDAPPTMSRFKSERELRLALAIEANTKIAEPPHDGRGRLQDAAGRWHIHQSVAGGNRIVEMPGRAVILRDARCHSTLGEGR